MNRRVGGLEKTNQLKNIIIRMNRRVGGLEKKALHHSLLH